ncbi:hypothetical protein Poly30_51950 [Planctomycetes bacterium Poly30]|uniref:Retropepsin-like aspartic endopeptidase domain-containing protein n=1 Tax=Saltatorellus ferox TaxID=2528018 RepID=A0A518EZX4_9BACT|nr:hypothetical protein Poly30_51950 [Planctomycetes bacterium Poly30]
MADDPQDPDPTNPEARRTSPRVRSHLPLIGWREWLALPGLGIPKVKAKVDTGARSSAIHAFGIERRRAEGRDRVAFFTHPRQRGDGPGLSCSAELLDVRTVRSSNGAIEERYFIRTLARLHGIEWPIELTLTERNDMSFRMLLGREAIRGRFLVDSGRSFLDQALVSKKKKKAPRRLRP